MISIPVKGVYLGCRLDPQKGVPTLSYEELLTDLRRGDREEMMLRSPILRRDMKINLCVFKGQKIQKRTFRPISRILPLMALLIFRSDPTLMVFKECRAIDISWGGSLAWDLDLERYKFKTRLQHFDTV